VIEDKTPSEEGLLVGRGKGLYKKQEREKRERRVMVM